MLGEVVPRAKRWSRKRSGEKDVSRLEQLEKINWVLCSKKMPAMVKGKVFKRGLSPTMLYGLEKDAFSRGLTKKLEVDENAAIALLDRVRNEEVRRDMEAELGCRLRWLGLFGEGTNSMWANE